MSLQPRRPPGHAKRKALVFAADILKLRRAGHSLAAIRDALEDAGVHVSISTVRREVLKGTSTTAACMPSAVESAESAPPPPLDSMSHGVGASRPVAASRLTPTATALPGRATAEEFMRGRPTNTLFLKEPTK